MNLVLRNIRQLVTVAAHSTPFITGNSMRELTCLANATLVIQNGKIVWIGPESTFHPTSFSDIDSFDASEYVILPGFIDGLTLPFFVDSWTSVFTPWSEPWEARASFQKYEIMNSLLTQIPKAQIKKALQSHLEKFFNCGTTTTVCAVGCTASENLHLLLFHTIRELTQELLIDLIPSYYIPPVPVESDCESYTKWLLHRFLPYLRERFSISHITFEWSTYPEKQIRQILQGTNSLGIHKITFIDTYHRTNSTYLINQIPHSLCFLTAPPTENDIRLFHQNKSVVLLSPSYFLFTKQQSFSVRSLIDAKIPLVLASYFHPLLMRTPSMQCILSLACTYFDLTPEEAIVAATYNSAAAYSSSSILGSIEVGKRADLILARCSSYHEIIFEPGINHIRYVVKNGTLLKL